MLLSPQSPNSAARARLKPVASPAAENRGLPTAKSAEMHGRRRRCFISPR